jgi:hypothetical protein
LRFQGIANFRRRVLKREVGNRVDKLGNIVKIEKNVIIIMAFSINVGFSTKINDNLLAFRIPVRFSLTLVNDSLPAVESHKTGTQHFHGSNPTNVLAATGQRLNRRYTASSLIQNNEP